MSFLPALIVALAASLAIEAYEGGRQRPISWRTRDLAIRFAACALVMLFWFAFSWRPWLAGFSAILTAAGLSLVSHLKRGVIGEPLVFSDFALLPQVPRHPDLYYTRPVTDPRIGGPLLAAVAGVALWYWLEPAILPRGWLAAGAAVLALPLGLLALATALARGPLSARLARLLPKPDLEADVARYGHAATILAYALRWRATRDAAAPAAVPMPAAPHPGAPRDEVVVVVQLESFVDPERLGGPALPAMDLFRRSAAQYGRLRVPAHGAYTMRTEHAVLTGRDAASLGFGVFDPYLSTGGHEPTSLARRADAAGYETAFVHPFHRDFFHRARVMRAFGFHRLVMEDEFAGAPRIGPYVGDVALGSRILAEVRGRQGPLLVFSVTMENHGPWKPGRLPGIDDPLAQYLHHVAHTGRMVEDLVAGLQGLRATLCVFGDHAPALPSCRPGFGDTATDYAIFRFGADEAGPPARVDLTADALGRLLRDTVSGVSTPRRAASVAVPRS
ncbi:LTA synthase family protein [Methylobacterium planeticum]|uniref:LTA synthase family protein n=1 Tax=Methylobacterium planeticum TaxID=2615211 RepID=A0A6N6MET8_9HYPH|nr:LTA synthase family protein [Methylobacterium planeticum]KAB1068259.1 LTA synthase family protein [Methylobacterium planeticum]